MLKFEGKFQEGEIIRSYDYEPHDDEKACYVQGTITNVTDNAFDQGYKAYMIHVDVDTLSDKRSRVGMEVAVPMQISLSEWDGRVTLMGGLMS